MKNSTKRSGLKLVRPRKVILEAGGREVFKPAGFRDGDQTLALSVEDNAYAYVGLYDGDVAVIYKTADVTPNDIAAVEISGYVWLGTYRPAPGGYFSFERDEQTEWFRPGTALLLGRVCHYERKGEIIRRLRPIR